MRRKQLSLLSYLFLLSLVVGGILFILSPKQFYSQDEKRPLQAAPELSLQSLTDGSFTSNIESYLSDHFPARKTFVGLHSYFDLFLGNNGENGVYMGKNGWLINKPIAVDEGNFTRNLKTMRDFTAQQGLSGTLMAVPSTGAILPEYLPSVHDTYPDERLLEQARKDTAGSLQWIDLTSVLEKNKNSAQLYYRTDHHWTSAGAYLGYTSLAQAEGWAALPKSAFRIKTFGGFYGTTYSTSGFWETKPDTVALWENPSLSVHVTLEDDDRKTDIQSNSVFFPEWLKQEDHYPVYLDGNHSLVRIVNPNATGGKLLIVKDSYANCLSTFLAEHYREIDMVDLRYFRKSTVSQIVKQAGIKNVLFVYGMDDLVNDRNLSLLS